MTEVNKDRLVHLFKQLVEIDSPSYQEREMADFLLDQYRGLGADIYEDDSAERSGSNAGNIYGYLKGTSDKALPTVLFSSHMDTVQPGIGKKSSIHEDGIITSDGSTVLGADDAAATAVILEAIRELQEEGQLYRNIEIFHPTAEETYAYGSKTFDFSKLSSKEAFCLDLSDKPGSYSMCEPTIIALNIEITGKAAHAGFEPENGIHSIKAAVNAIARLEQGRINDHTTLNIGTINGGSVSNAIPEHTVVTGEVRSLEHEEAIRLSEEVLDIFREEGEKLGAMVNATSQVRIHGYKIKDDNPSLKVYEEVLDKFGIKPYAKKNFGGSDNSVLIQNGIPGICIFNSMYNCHTVREYTKVDELVWMVELVKEIMCYGC